MTAGLIIGDRNGSADEVHDRLRPPGTTRNRIRRNIAIVAATVLMALMLCGIRGRAASIIALLVLTAYAQVVTAGPSVWRATLVAVLYFAARAVDLRTPPWQATAVAAALMVVLHPLDVCDSGFVLTFGATAALLEGARRGERSPGPGGGRQPGCSHRSSPHSQWRWLFSRCRPSVLECDERRAHPQPGAVPLMGAAQVAGVAVVVFEPHRLGRRGCRSLCVCQRHIDRRQRQARGRCTVADRTRCAASRGGILMYTPGWTAVASVADDSIVGRVWVTVAAQ